VPLILEAPPKIDTHVPGAARVYLMKLASRQVQQLPRLEPHVDRRGVDPLLLAGAAVVVLGFSLLFAAALRTRRRRRRY
jgi:hypothetical protein